MVAQEVQTVIELALKSEQVLNVLLTEKTHCALIVLYIERLRYFIPGLVLVNLRRGNGYTGFVLVHFKMVG